MTACALIADIFSRVQPGVASNIRRITPRQLAYLRLLIDADPQAAAVTRGAPGSLVWTPAGHDKYILTEDLRGTKHTLTRLSNAAVEGNGSLF